jgi:hypothetical protein
MQDVNRMLADPKSLFRFPDFDDNLHQASQNQTKSFIGSVCKRTAMCPNFSIPTTHSRTSG